MAAGDLWTMPGGHKGLEMEGSSPDVLRLSVIVEGWPFPKPPILVARVLCQRAPSRYLHGQVTEEARW